MEQERNPSRNISHFLRESLWIALFKRHSDYVRRGIDVDIILKKEKEQEIEIEIWIGASRFNFFPLFFSFFFFLGGDFSGQIYRRRERGWMGMNIQRMDLKI